MFCSLAPEFQTPDLRTLTLAPRCGAVIEKYTRNTRFCLICNYASKIIPALQSRCTRFRFPPLPESNVRERVSFVAQHEGCAAELMLLLGFGYRVRFRIEG